jgi:hypothetical protein
VWDRTHAGAGLLHALDLCVLAAVPEPLDGAKRRACAAS